MRENGDTYMGRHEDGFKAAAQAAVEEFEREQGGPPEEPMELRVVEMYVTVHNPIHEYRVVLGPAG